MKQLTCEMCGSTDLMKQDGIFVCQSCGCKYSVEEAKKLMIEGSVDVSGSTVKVDNSSFVENYLANARRAKEKTDWEEVEKYYNLVEQNDPTNIEAIFYSAYAKTMLTLSVLEGIRRREKFDILAKSISIIDDCYDIKKSSELAPLIKNMSQDILNLKHARYVYNESMDYCTSLAFKVQSLQAQVHFIETIENIADKDPKPYLFDILLAHYESAIQEGFLYLYCSDKKIPQLEAVYRKKLADINERKQRENPNYQPKVIPEKSGGCYVATAVYGSYDCAQVWTLRRFRDYTLAETWYGRAFIRTYYAISPTLVRWFGDAEWFKKMWKNPLDRMVARLNAEGVEDTPYEDRNW